MEGLDFCFFCGFFEVPAAGPAAAAGELAGLKNEKRVDDCSGTPLRLILSLSHPLSPSTPTDHVGVYALFSREFRAELGSTIERAQTPNNRMCCVEEARGKVKR